MWAGSVLVFGGSELTPKASAKTWINALNKLQKAALSTRLGIPIIIGTDAVHGHNNAYNATIFPHNVGLGVTRQTLVSIFPHLLDPELVKKIGAATSLEARATGITYTFAPCIAVCRDPRWIRCFESYSEDHKIVQAMTEIIPGLQGDIPTDYPKKFPFISGRTKVAACAKHFVGDGGTTNGIDENNTVIDWDGLQRIHIPAYIDSINKGVATVMVSYSSWNGVKMHANYDLITGYLKNKLGFKGFVISDWEGIDKITTPPHANYTYSVQAGILAGIDMVMVPEKYVEFIDELTLLVKKNVIPMSRIDDAVERILRVKLISGLFDNPMGDFSLVSKLGNQKHRELAREAVRRSLVLLKNGKNADQPLIPLPTNPMKILVAGTHADNIGYQCGGWTIEWSGLSGNITIGTTILTAVKNSVDPLTEIVYNENPNKGFVKSNGFSYAIVVVGELAYSDSVDLRLADPGYDVITNVLAAWLPGTEGQGVADVLFGDYGFTGKLARTWFRAVDQLPMNVGDANYDPLFPFGYGLTTTPRKLTSTQ
ncbi:hypothetical protein BUALT_Bualt02G0007900 [Buddleja alternifolia]|uniref:beta-glucosidase n=1 Tax=Buddleja alternifolia TaxID=168488 RepID=A0AAV6XXS6_9LAMI|nr:hypothetical protein BUALT_Bualt02G0007900 [Buddleja alternifolia]